MIDILITASPLFTVGGIVGLCTDNPAIVLLAQMIATAIMMFVSGLGGLLKRVGGVE